MPNILESLRTSCRTFIIAEAGVNHDGDFECAKRLIDIAADSGADAVKFQLFSPEDLASSEASLAEYQSVGSVENQPKNQLDMLSGLALPFEAHLHLQDYCRKKGILFLCTPFDFKSADYLHSILNVPLLKVSSGEITNLPFLEFLGTLGIPIVLSTGMANMAEIQAAVDITQRHNQADVALLHCVSAYPAPVEAVNLRAIQTLGSAFPQALIGYSDHTLGIHVAVAAVALGARIVEKHFTYDPSAPGPDHQASLSPGELREMVRAIRDLEKALGDGVKQPHPCESDCLSAARKSLVAAQDLAAGHILQPGDLVAKRPGTGLPPAALPQVLGKRLNISLSKDCLLKSEFLD